MSRRRHASSVALSLDSFLDIVTNVAGVLILVAVVTVLSAGDVSMSLGTPILHAANEGAARILFECRAGRISRLPEREFTREIERLSKELGEQGLTQDAVEKMLDSGTLRDAAYRVRLRVTNGAPMFLFEPRYAEQGETVGEIKLGSSEYRRYLSLLNPKLDYLYFIVREDGFDVFREARKVAAKLGLQVGWYPKQSREPLLFGGVGPGTVSTDIQR
jgi:hypothetical protein